MQDIKFFKIVVAGDGGVGKTTLLHRYVNGGFLEETPMTIGLEIFNKQIEVNGNFYKVVFWDVAGQEQFRSLHQSLIKGVMGAIFMFDMSRLATLQSINEWVSILRTNDNDVPILLVGSKYDLVSDSMNKSEIYEIHDYALEMRNEHRLFDYIFTSSKVGYNIDDTFVILLEKARNHLRLKKIMNKFPLSTLNTLEIED